jgi:hypothetical protein
MSLRQTGLRGVLLAPALALAVAFAAGTAPAPAAAAGLEDDGGSEWRLQPTVPPELPGGQKSGTPIGLGPVGDIEFWAPNRGLLITAGSGSTIPPGVWAYNGVSWHELSDKCGATDGRIAWAGPEEFWTVSDGRPGQAASPQGLPAPLQDNTLCHFKAGAIVKSYASPAFQSSSYQPMHAAACLAATDCWFAGDALPEPQVGAFHLHWNGRSGTLEAQPYEQEGHSVQDMRPFAGSLFESVRLVAGDPVLEHSAEPPVLHLINPLGVTPIFEPLGGLPLYGPNEFPEALDALHLSADGEALWAAAGPRSPTPEGSEPARVTVARYSQAFGWSQVLGPASLSDPFPGDVVKSIAADPTTGAAWLALAAQGESANDPTAHAVVARVAADGTVSDEQTLPSAQESSEGVGPKGAAAAITCPAPHECWLATTQGWLFHLADRPLGSPPPEGVDADPAFAGLITYRPPDEGLPQVVPDAPPPDDSGLLGEPPPSIGSLLETSAPTETRISVALISHIHSRLVHGTTLELRFHLAVKARVRLIAKRRTRVVASTPQRTLASGNRKLMLALDRRRWPTKLDLQAHPLAKVPTTSTRGAGNDTVGTGVVVLPKTYKFGGSDPLR